MKIVMRIGYKSMKYPKAGNYNLIKYKKCWRNNVKTDNTDNTNYPL